VCKRSEEDEEEGGMTTREGSSQSATAGLDYMLDCAFWQAGAPSFKDEAGLKSEPTLLLVAGTHAGAGFPPPFFSPFYLLSSPSLK